jgi:hypothetical protein
MGEMTVDYLGGPLITTRAYLRGRKEDKEKDS